jgi:hypothetical protein
MTGAAATITIASSSSVVRTRLLYAVDEYERTF